MMNILRMCNHGWSVKLGKGLALHLPLGGLATLRVSVDISMSLFPIYEVGRLEWRLLGIA